MSWKQPFFSYFFVFIIYQIIEFKKVVVSCVMFLFTQPKTNIGVRAVSARQPIFTKPKNYRDICTASGLKIQYICRVRCMGFSINSLRFRIYVFFLFLHKNRLHSVPFT